MRHERLKELENMIEEKTKIAEVQRLRLVEGPNQATFREKSDLEFDNLGRQEMYSSHNAGLNTAFLINPSDSRVIENFRQSYDEPISKNQRGSKRDSSIKSLKSILKKKEKSASQVSHDSGSVRNKSPDDQNPHAPGNTSRERVLRQLEHFNKSQNVSPTGDSRLGIYPA